METTIKISKETKERILSLDLTEKGKSFDMIVNDLITFYREYSKKYSKDCKKWEHSMKEHQKAMVKYKNEEKMWENLLIWAKSKGFKG